MVNMPVLGTPPSLVKEPQVEPWKHNPDSMQLHQLHLGAPPSWASPAFILQTPGCLCQAQAWTQPIHLRQARISSASTHRTKEKQAERAGT